MGQGNIATLDLTTVREDTANDIEILPLQLGIAIQKSNKNLQSNFGQFNYFFECKYIGIKITEFKGCT